jgi:hypothetical protein
MVLGISALVAVAASAAPAPAAAQPAAASAADAKIADDLKAFCKKWMGFLETRERDNKRGVKWRQDPSGVKGQYVGYSTSYDCTMKERSSNGTPVATIVYREYLYEASGASQDAALAGKPSVIEVTEVTEIFRYTKGEWVY